MRSDTLALRAEEHPRGIPCSVSRQPHSRQLKESYLFMLIRLGYDISFDIPLEVPMVALLNVYQTRVPDLREPDILRTEPEVKIDAYTDVFGNQCSRFVAPPGTIRLYNST